MLLCAALLPNAAVSRDASSVIQRGRVSNLKNMWEQKNKEAAGRPEKRQAPRALRVQDRGFKRRDVLHGEKYGNWNHPDAKKVVGTTYVPHEEDLLKSRSQLRRTERSERPKDLGHYDLGTKNLNFSQEELDEMKQHGSRLTERQKNAMRNAGRSFGR